MCLICRYIESMIATSYVPKKHGIIGSREWVDVCNADVEVLIDILCLFWLCRGRDRQNLICYDVVTYEPSYNPSGRYVFQYYGKMLSERAVSYLNVDIAVQGQYRGIPV